MLGSLRKGSARTASDTRQGAGPGGSLSGLDSFAGWLARHFKKPAALVGVEVFVALSLALYYFFLMLYGCSGRYVELDNTFSNTQIFTYLSHHPITEKVWFLETAPEWKTRLAGPMLSGALTDKVWDYCAARNFDPVKCHFAIGSWRHSAFHCAFGFYHAAWLFLLFCLLIYYRTDALLIILGTFAGLMLGISNVGGYRSYTPFDIPAMFFFTWAFISYDNTRRMLPLAAVICLGALFRETVAICALLILFGQHWPWRKRVVGFVVTVGLYLALKKFLLLVYDVPVNAFSWNNFFTKLFFFHNVQLTFVERELNGPFCANAGALLLMFLLPWRSYRDGLFRLVAGAFLGSMVVFGTVTESRIWLEILPLGWVIVSEFVASRAAGFRAAQGSGTPEPAAAPPAEASKAARIAYWLTLAVLAVVVAGVSTVIAISLELGQPTAPSADGQSDLGKQQTAPGDFGSGAANRLAWTLATSPQAEMRDASLAVQMAELVCARTQYRNSVFVGTLAAAYAEAGRFDDAIASAQKACALATESGQAELLARNKQLLALYRARQPYHEAPPPPPKPSDSFYR